MSKYKKFRPDPAFYTQEDEPVDLFILVLKIWFYLYVVLVLLILADWIITGYPTYIELWRTRPMFVGALTQVMLCVAVPAFCGVYFGAMHSTKASDASKVFATLLLVPTLIAQGAMLFWLLWNCPQIMAACMAKPIAAGFCGSLYTVMSIMGVCVGVTSYTQMQ